MVKEQIKLYICTYECFYDDTIELFINKKKRTSIVISDYLTRQEFFDTLKECLDDN